MKPSFDLETVYYGFQGLFPNMLQNLETMVWGLKDIILLHNNTILFVTIDKFDPNLVLININKLKPYKFIEDKTLHLYWSNWVTWSLMNLFKPENLIHYLLNLKVFNM